MNTIGVDVDSRNLVCQIRRNGKDFPKAAIRLGALGRVVANDTAVTLRHLERRIRQMEQASLELIEAILS